MDEEGFFAVGCFYVGFWDARAEVEDGVTVAGGVWLVGWGIRWGREGRDCARVEFEGLEDSWL